MNLHEYQGKALFAEYNLPVSKGVVIFEPEEALKACRDIGGTKWVVKAQVHAGGRGKAGGVKLVDTPDDAIDFARSWLGKKLVTYQTDTNGQLVNSILVEECTDIDQELYLSAVIDRDSQRIVFIGSSEGGVNIEEVAENTPDKLNKSNVSYYKIPVNYEIRGNFLGYIKFKRELARSNKMLNFDKEAIKVVQSDKTGAILATGVLTIVGMTDEFF